MVKKVTVRQTGTSVSATIPRDVADRLHIGVGDSLFAIETEDGVLFTPYDPTIERAMVAVALIFLESEGLGVGRRGNQR